MPRGEPPAARVEGGPGSRGDGQGGPAAAPGGGRDGADPPEGTPPQGTGPPDATTPAEGTARGGSRRARRRAARTGLTRRLGLRARVTAAFAIGAFVLSTLMAGITYFTARQTLLNDRQSAVQRQAFANASFVQSALRSPGTQVSALLGSIDTLPGSLSVLRTGGQWYATSISIGQSAIPASERSLVLAGTPASQFFVLSGTHDLVIGVPLPAVHSAYFEVFSLEELAGTLRDLAYALAAAALFTTLAGAALGRWASSRALRPLSDITDAAVAVAGGDLDTRIDAGDDVDLQELAAAFNRMTANLKERIEREARFTSDVSHELRSPLTTLSASIGVLESHRDELDPRAQSALDLLDGDMRRFTRMVDELLEISRFDAGSAELTLEEVDPRELVLRSVAASAPPAEDGRRTAPFAVEVGPGVDGLRLRVDKRRFERVMANLVDNANLYAGGVSRVLVERWPAVDGSPGGPARTIRVVVEDEGPGVPAARAAAPLRALLPREPVGTAGIRPWHRARPGPRRRARPAPRRAGVERTGVQAREPLRRGAPPPRRRRAGGRPVRTPRTAPLPARRPAGARRARLGMRSSLGRQPDRDRQGRCALPPPQPLPVDHCADHTAGRRGRRDDLPRGARPASPGGHPRRAGAGQPDPDPRRAPRRADRRRVGGRPPDLPHRLPRPGHRVGVRRGRHRRLLGEPGPRPGGGARPDARDRAGGLHRNPAAGDRRRAVPDRGSGDRRADRDRRPGVGAGQSRLLRTAGTALL